MTNSLRSCAGCSAHILTNDTTSERAWCARCKPKHVTPFDQWVETLGNRRAALLAELAEVEAALHVEMRKRRAEGATLQEIIAASGYRSIDGVRKILDPAVKRGAADARTKRLRNRADVAKLV